MQNLFDILPENFFNLFTGRNRRFYAEVALILQEQFYISRAGIQYLLMKDEIQELIETKDELGERIIFDEVDEEKNHDPGARAAMVLRRLKELKWIEVETRNNFEDFIVLPSYSSRILTVLKEICQNKTIEYQRYCFVTFQLLTGEEANSRPATAILESAKNSENFINELTILLHNMKHHMEQITAKTEIQQILEHHFGEYKKEIIDKSYHRLRTSDHVSRYRHKILERIQTWYLDEEFIIRAAKDGIESGYFVGQNEAIDTLKKAMYSIEDIYSKLDEIWYQIDIRHSQYLRAVVERARYLSNFNDTNEYNISYILENFYTTEKLTNTNSLFHILNLKHLQEASHFSPRKKRGIHQSEEHQSSEIDEELRKKLKEENQNKINNAVNRKKIKEFVLKNLNERNQMEIGELSLENQKDILYMAYIYLYGHDGKSGFSLSKEIPNLVEKNGYLFSNRTIIRDESGG